MVAPAFLMRRLGNAAPRIYIRNRMCLVPNVESAGTVAVEFKA